MDHPLRFNDTEVIYKAAGCFDRLRTSPRSRPTEIVQVKLGNQRLEVRALKGYRRSHRLDQAGVTRASFARHLARSRSLRCVKSRAVGTDPR